ncbi:MAG: DsrE family protein [Symbiobacteriia bacterium]
MQPSICVLISQAPYGVVHAAEGLRHVNGALANGFSAVALFVDEGVWTVHKGQQAGVTGFTSLSGAMADALQKAGGPVPRLVVHRPSMEARGLTPEELVPGAELVDDAGMARIITSTQFLLRY